MMLVIKKDVFESMSDEDRILMRNIDASIDLQVFVQENPSLGLTANQIEVVETL